jgi:hypothetical protein
VVADAKSPIVYGWDGAQLPVYFNQDPVLAVGGFGGRGGFGGGAQIAGVGMTVAPNASVTQKLSPWEPASSAAEAPAQSTGPGGGRAGAPGGAPEQAMGRGGPGAGPSAGSGQTGFAGFGSDLPRVILRFPVNPDEMLLSGVLVGGQALSGRAQVVDAPVGTGHVVMFAIRPYWRWQTQGTFFLGFNAIMNWNDLSAGK